MEITLGLLGIVTTVIGLFGWLLKKVMEENSKREAEYRTVIAENQKIINNLADKLADLKDLKISVDDLRREVHQVAQTG